MIQLQKSDFSLPLLLTLQTLLTHPLQSIISPHLYPPSITMSTWLGDALWEQSNVSFGYLQSPGYCAANGCTAFPVFVGETGSAYHTDVDKQWLQDFSDFVMARVRYLNSRWRGSALGNTVLQTLY